MNGNTEERRFRLANGDREVLVQTGIALLEIVEEKYAARVAELERQVRALQSNESSMTAMPALVRGFDARLGGLNARIDKLVQTVSALSKHNQSLERKIGELMRK
jgi:hypothetical protein